LAFALQITAVVHAVVRNVAGEASGARAAAQAAVEAGRASLVVLVVVFQAPAGHWRRVCEQLSVQGQVAARA
jgi:hypothetical protein